MPDLALAHLALFPSCNFFMLYFFMLHFFHIALSSCCTFLMLKNIENERDTESTTKKRPYTTQHHELVSPLFGYLIAHFIHSFERQIKWKGTNLAFCLSRLETFKTRVWNYENENWGWMDSEKYTRVEKILVLVLLFSKLLNHNYRPK